MKKWLCLVMTLVMLAACLPSLAASYTLPEKLYRQLAYGSGLKGSFTLETTGDADWAQALSALSGVDLELRGICTDGVWQYQLYAQDEAGDQLGRTWVYGDANTVAMSSELVPDTLLTVQTGGDALNLLSGSSEGNPAWYSIAAALLNIDEETWAEEWEPVLSPYYRHIEMWMTAFAARPEQQKQTDGSTLMRVSYTIPADQVKTEALALLKLMFEEDDDDALETLLGSLMTDAQREAYLKADRLDYYAGLLEALPLDGEILLARTMTTAGETVDTTVSLPLPGNGEWKTIDLVQENGDTSVVLMSDTATLSLALKENSLTENGGTWSGAVSVVTEAEEKRWDITVSHTDNTYTDGENRGHDEDAWTVSLVPDTGDAVNLEVLLHYSGKNAQTSATTLLVDALLSIGDSTLKLNATLKSSSPWILEELPLEGGEDPLTMTEERRAELLNTWLTAAGTMLNTLHGVTEENAEATEETAEATEETAETTEEPDAAETAEANDEPDTEETAEATEEPVAEPTVEPAAEPTAAPTAEPTAEPTAAPTTAVTVTGGTDQATLTLNAAAPAENASDEDASDEDATDEDGRENDDLLIDDEDDDLIIEDELITDDGDDELIIEETEERPVKTATPAASEATATEAAEEATLSDLTEAATPSDLAEATPSDLEEAAE